LHLRAERKAAVGQEADQVLDQQIRLLQRGEVAASRHHGEPLDGEEALGVLPAR
jgi:hypothetical protein